MKVKALKPWSNGEISMEQYEVRDLPDVLAQNLIDAGIVVEIGGGSGGGVLVVTGTDGTLDKTWQEIHDAMLSGGAVVSFSETDTGSVVTAMYNDKDEAYVIIVCDRVGAGEFATYFASTASGYPSIE